MITVVIPYKGEEAQLSALLVSLQPQLHPDDDIYIIDKTPERSGLKIASLYGTTRCIIFVDTNNSFDREQAENAGFENCVQNKQEGALVLSPNLMISQTFVSNLKKAIRMKGELHHIIIPKLVSLPYPKMSSEFIWFALPTQELKTVGLSPEMDNCFYIDEFGISDKLFYAGKMVRVGQFDNESVYIFPYKSTNPDIS